MLLSHRPRALGTNDSPTAIVGRLLARVANAVGGRACGLRLSVEDPVRQALVGAFVARGARVPTRMGLVASSITLDERRWSFTVERDEHGPARELDPQGALRAARRIDARKRILFGRGAVVGPGGCVPANAHVGRTGREEVARGVRDPALRLRVLDRERRDLERGAPVSESIDAAADVERKAHTDHPRSRRFEPCDPEVDRCGQLEPDALAPHRELQRGLASCGGSSRRHTSAQPIQRRPSAPRATGGGHDLITKVEDPGPGGEVLVHGGPSC